MAILITHCMVFTLVHTRMRQVAGFGSSPTTHRTLPPTLPTRSTHLLCCHLPSQLFCLGHQRPQHVGARKRLRARTEGVREVWYQGLTPLTHTHMHVLAHLQLHTTQHLVVPLLPIHTWLSAAVPITALSPPEGSASPRPALAATLSYFLAIFSTAA